MTELDTLALNLQAAKAAEEVAKDARIKAEEDLINLLGIKSEGAQTHKGDAFKITITAKVNRTLDVAAWDAIKDHIPAKYQPVKYKPEIDVTGLKWLKDHEAGIYATVCQAISAKPGKPAVTIQPIEAK